MEEAKNKSVIVTVTNLGASVLHFEAEDQEPIAIPPQHEEQFVYPEPVKVLTPASDTVLIKIGPA